MQYATAVHAAQTLYWSDPKHARYIDEPTITLLYAMATEEMLDGDENIGHARRLNSLAT